MFKRKIIGALLHPHPHVNSLLAPLDLPQEPPHNLACQLLWQVIWLSLMAPSWISVYLHNWLGIVWGRVWIPRLPFTAHVTQDKLCPGFFSHRTWTLPASQRSEWLGEIKWGKLQRTAASVAFPLPQAVWWGHQSIRICVILKECCEWGFVITFKTQTHYIICPSDCATMWMGAGWVPHPCSGRFTFPPSLGRTWVVSGLW